MILPLVFNKNSSLDSRKINKNLRTIALKFILVICAFLSANCYEGQSLNIDSCLRVLKTSKDDTNKVILLSDIAWDISYQNLQKGIMYAEESMVLAKKLGAERQYGKSFHVAGAIYNDMSEQGKALELFLESLKYSKKYNQLEQMGFIYNSLGNFYTNREDVRKAITYYLQAIAAHKKVGAEENIYTPYNNLGGAYSRIGKPDSAIYYLNISTTYNYTHNNRSKLLYNYINLSEIYTDTPDKAKGLDYARKAVSIARQDSDKYTLARALTQLSSVYYVTKKYMEAIVTLEECTRLAKEMSDLTTMQASALLSSQAYEEIGDYKNALARFTEYKAYNDSILNSENIRQIRTAEAKYENEKKQAEIELLSEKQKSSDAKREKDRLYLYLSGIGIVCLIFMLLFLFRNNRAKQKVNAALALYNTEVKHQKDLVEEKNKEITDSINYAKRIQQSLLTSHDYFKKHTSDFFILFKPKDIVSGDFYWALDHEGKFMVMTADCTGHGVPGAMMSMMGINFINEIVNEKKITSPADVLNQLKKEIIKALNPEGSVVEGKDGMDCSLCSFDFANKKLVYANANNSFYIIRNGTILHAQLNKMPVGAGHNFETLFDNFEIDLQKDDLIVTFTDGYADQFGGSKGKKFKYKQLEKLLVDHSHLPLKEIQKKLDDTIEEWKGNLSQVDDICIIGIKI